ncbi:diacylglycerol kinase family protein [Thermus filiformis]|uniref:diacylglycerol kinase family protein n=1 Tax=Thermus filiformis TaxID=276 RepID=UPI0005EC37C2|nr:diacylglycerol kinase family protein [Thermus filiformis]
MGGLPPRPRENPHPLKGVLASFGFALEGLRYAWREQRNLRVQGLFALLALGLAFWLRVDPVPILLASGLVLSLELVNTALEALTDLAAPTYHPLAKRAKDTAAASVLLASLFALLVGLFHLLPPLLGRLGLS